MVILTNGGIFKNHSQRKLEELKMRQNPPLYTTEIVILPESVTIRIFFSNKRQQVSL